MVGGKAVCFDELLEAVVPQVDIISMLSRCGLSWYLNGNMVVDEERCRLIWSVTNVNEKSLEPKGLLC